MSSQKTPLSSSSPVVGQKEEENLLYYGDNLDILRKHIKDESVDLIYLDPPFNSKANYNVIFKNKDKKDSPAQIQAFDDTWSWTSESEIVYDQLMNTKIGAVMSGLREIVGTNDLMAYLVMMAIRLIELHRVLKNTGSLYLHCDPTASHYLKIILDAVFYPENFRNEIVWRRATSGQKGSQHETRKLGNNHDIILTYCKDAKSVKFIPPKRQLTQQEIDKKFKNVDKKDGRRWTDDSSHIWRTPGMGRRPNLCYEWKGFKNPHPAGWRLSKEKLQLEYEKGNFEIIKKSDGTRKLIRKAYLDDYDGENIGDIWIDIDPAQGNERMGYPTQKPLALLERIIKTSSNEGDVILDSFCGCGTAVIAAQKLNRGWIGIDVTHLAVNLIEKRMMDSFGISTKVIGVPQSVEAAQKLAESDKFQFELWAISLIPKLHSNQRQVGDKGVDGRGQIMVGLDKKKDNKPKYEKIIASVKGGNKLTPSMVRDLVGTVQSEKAAFGIFICMKKPTKKMSEAAVKGGIYKTPLGRQYQRVQIYTIEDYFNGLRPDIPDIVDNMKEAQSQRKPESGVQTTL